MTATLLVDILGVPEAVDDAGSANPSLALPATSPDDGFDRSREYFGAFLPAKPDAPLPFTRPPIDAPTLTEAVRAICQATH